MFESEELSQEEVLAIWGGLEQSQMILENLPSTAQGQVISGLLGIWVARHYCPEHREEFLKWAVECARGMVPMVDAGIVSVAKMGVAGNA